MQKRTRALSFPWAAATVLILAAVAVPAAGVCSECDTGKLTDAYGAETDGSDGGTFVEFAPISDDSGGVP